MTLNLSMPKNDQTELKPRITVFGVGGAGGNAVNNMIEKELAGVEFVTANTDAQALQQSRAPAKIQMGVKVTEGLGAGAKAQIGAAAAEETIEEIVDHLAGAHMCFITAGMGGGTGTGAAPIIAQAARELGVLTVGVVTKPFQFEGGKRMRQAEEGVERLQKVVDTLIIIPNQNLFRLANEKTTFTEAFSLADDVLYQGVKGVTDLMVRPGLINLDFADVRAVMDEMGKAMMGTGESDGEDRAIQAAEKAIANPLLDEISLKGAKGVLINITGGHDLTLFELDEAANRIREEVDPDANIIVGSTLDAEMEGRMRVSVVATGIDATAASHDIPRPRRSMSEPLTLRTAEPAEQERDDAPAAAAVPAPEREAEVAEAPEPGLFDTFPARDAEEAPDDETADDALPPPAYRPEPPVAARDQAPEEPAFVAPKGPATRGQPSAETLARLQAAVGRSRPAQEGGIPAGPAHTEERAAAERGQSGRFGIGSLINRMSGHGGEAQAHRAEPHLRSEPREAAPRPQPRASIPPRGYEDEPDTNPEQERIEIPAFLRRQAN
ncbi:MAG: cell division protein FtsZ [Paracoccaceae bacterium]|jgi:cell division protein FtsZ|nr:cell division protein FtsZ [Paracoccaceae bacterium]